MDSKSVYARIEPKWRKRMEKEKNKMNMSWEEYFIYLYNERRSE